jgi:hypothetical protein
MFHPASDRARALATTLHRALNNDPALPGLRVPTVLLPEEGSNLPPTHYDLDEAEISVAVLLADDYMVAEEDEGHQSWGEFAADLAERCADGQHRFLPVQLSEAAWPLHESLNTRNFIRAFTQNNADRDAWVERRVVIELCRVLLGKQRGDIAPLRLYLSYAEQDGRRMYEAVVVHLNATQHFEAWIDSSNIDPDEDFGKAIEDVIRESAVLILATNSYSGRPWCRREALAVKKYARPAVVLDGRQGVSLGFPDVGNVPVVAWDDGAASRAVDLLLKEQLRHLHIGRLPDQPVAHATTNRRAEGDKGKIFVSYRRNDSKHITARIVERVEKNFGNGNVFRDVGNVLPGTDYRDHIRTVLLECDILVAVIYFRWKEELDNYVSRHTEENPDWVRFEISFALERKIPVIPLLIDGTAMPTAAELPSEMRNLVYRQAITFDSEDFEVQIQRLIKSLDRKIASVVPRAADDHEEALLAGRKIALSISISDDLQRLGLLPDHLDAALLEISRCLLVNGASLAYGGPPGSPALMALFDLVRENERNSSLPPAQRISSYLAWPLPLTIEQRAKFRNQVTFVRTARPPGIESLEPGTFVAEPAFFPTSTPERRYAWARGLSLMREQLTMETDARILIGGKTSGYLGRIPGAVEEAVLSLQAGRPVYLCGAFGGAAALVIELLDGRVPHELTWEYQSQTPYSEAMRQLYKDQGAPWQGYEELADICKGIGVKGLSDANHLTEAENRELFRSRDVPRIVELLLTGLTQ